jgi:capsular exopolysaccharide synthesis family protein
MSRVHEALRKAEQLGAAPAESAPAVPSPQPSEAVQGPGLFAGGSFLDQLEEVPFRPAPEALLIDLGRPQEAPSEEFRSLRTKLNHLQGLQPLHTLVVTSASPAEGKSFVACNLALSEAQLSGNYTLLADFDFRRPVIHNLFQISRTPGVTDYLLGNAPLEAVIKRVAGSNLFLMPAGASVKNPLELLNLRQARVLLRELPRLFHWVILDSPPLLFSADANLMGTLTDATILVVRIGQTTIDMVTRAMQSLCENNVLGVVVNGARAGELYSKYTYYYSSYRERPEQADGALAPAGDEAGPPAPQDPASA